MSDTTTNTSDADDFIAEADTGARTPNGKFSRGVLWSVPLIWSLFQLWIASPIPYEIGFGVVNNSEARSIHLAFAVFLAFTAFPTFKPSPRTHIPIQDLVFACIGVVLLMEAARRSLGFPLMAVGAVFLGYVFFGSSKWLPDVIRWRGASIERAMSHMWLTSEGVFDVALGVSSGFVFLFVPFGALLNQAGAGNYFLSLAFATLGHLRGGPAKAAVIASAATGLISGSSNANVVTTGTFTIPLMKKVGFSPSKAGAVEVSSSINGILTPPAMGAIAFLITEYVGISYVEVVKSAIVPAAISYVALVYIVHLEVLKMGMKGTSRMNPIKFILGAIMIICIGIIIAGGTLYAAGLLVLQLHAVNPVDPANPKNR